MTHREFVLNRRKFMLFSGLSIIYPSSLGAAFFREISWDELIPGGVPYGAIVAEGDVNEEDDTWKPVFDDNAKKINTNIDGSNVRLPGYMIPIEMSAQGVGAFILVPYVGACIHVPPPPPNQLVFVETDIPWQNASLWSAVWVSGKIHAQNHSTEIAEAGYFLKAELVENYTAGPRNQRFAETPVNPFNW